MIAKRNPRWAKEKKKKKGQLQGKRLVHLRRFVTKPDSKRKVVVGEKDAAGAWSVLKSELSGPERRKKMAASQITTTISKKGS